MSIVIQNGKVWNGQDYEQADIVINGNKIIEIGGDYSESDMQKVDASGKYILPGIIDCHVHLSMNGGAHPMADLSKASEAEALLVAVKSAEKLLKAGITTVRECGGIGLESVILKKAIAKKEYIGPSIITCGKAIKIPGGHFVGVEVTGPEEARKAARELIRDGGEYIKLMATGGLGKIGEKPGVVELDVDEMKAAAAEGKKHEMTVVAHCHSKEGMLNALEAGATSIEHATFIDEEVVDKMLEHDVFLTPTFSPYELIATYGKENGVSEYMCNMAASICEYKNKTFHLAYEKGVKISFGRDAGAPFTKHEDYVFEMKAMEKAGMAKKDIIKSATETAAKALNLWDTIGSIEAGKSADLIILAGDPTENLEYFYKVETVIKEGIII